MVARRWTSALAVLVAIGSAHARNTPDDLVEALTEIDAVDGIVTAEDVADFARPANPWRFSFLTSTRWSTARPQRLDGSVAGEQEGLGFAGRWRHDGLRVRSVGWLRMQGPRVGLGLGAARLNHGLGLLMSPVGARSAFGPDVGLQGSRPGWRPSTSLGADQLDHAVWCHVKGSRYQATIGATQRGTSRPGGIVRLTSESDGRTMSVLTIAGDRWRGSSLATGWTAAEWRVAVETALWATPDGTTDWAAVAAIRHTLPRLIVEGQVGLANAVSPPAGGLRPACLSGWLGRGWVARVQTRRGATVRAGLALSWARDRDPDHALGRVRERRRLALSIQGRTAGHGRWECRIRRSQYGDWTWIDAAPWRPPALTSRKTRTWLLLQDSRPAGSGLVTVSWRQLLQDGLSQQLVSVRWRGDLTAVRVAAAIQSAWGDGLDLVTVAVPVSGQVAVHHWGAWRSGWWLGLQGRGRWSWQLAALVRRPTDLDAPAVIDTRLGFGGRF